MGGKHAGNEALEISAKLATMKDQYRRAHVWVAEQVLGRSLPKGAVVHHIDGNHNNNEKSNLMICPSQSYHKLIHARQKALEESGDPNKRKCCLCRKYDFVENMIFYSSTRNHRHKECRNKNFKEWKSKNPNYQSEWRKRNPEKMSLYRARRSAREIPSKLER